MTYLIARTIVRLGCPWIACLSVLVVAMACPIEAQTYQVGSPSTSGKPQTQSGQATAQTPSLGWGSNIQNARLARAAQLALEKGDHALALSYAQRAAQAAPNDPQLWFLLGYAARLDGKFQQAADAYQHGLHLSPSSLDGISGLAQTYSNMGKTDDAERLLKQVIAADPKRANDELLLGDMMMRSGDYQGALDPLTKAERVQPGSRSELLLAISYQRLKKLDVAKRYLEMAKNRAPNNPDVERSLAGYYRETGNYADAIAALKSIRNPRPDVKAELGYTYQLDGKLEDAARLYTQAADAMPKDIGLQLSAAQAEVALGSIDHADGFLKRAAAIDPNFYRLHAIRGQIARLQEHDEDAVKEYNAALEHLPESPAEGPLYGIQLHVDLMQLYQSVQQPDAAHQQLAIAQKQIAAVDEQGPGRPSFLRLRAMIRMSGGDLDGARNDLNEALALNSSDPSSLQLDGDLLMKMGHTEEAIGVYKRILAMNPTDRYALTSLGFASRTAGRDDDAERYFDQLAQAYPNLYVPYLALGDLYTARRDFSKAQTSYSKGYELAPANALIVAGGMNAAIEAHKLDLAAVWMKRVRPAMEGEPQVLREEERYLSFKGDYQQSAEVARKVLPLLPKDRDVVVYLGYDLLNLQKYSELLNLTTKYNNELPREPDIPLLAGYVYKHDGDLEKARQAFTEALQRDPQVVTAYVNRGYVLHDLHQPQAAASDFDAAIRRDPKDGEAHLGLAYTGLDLHKPQLALRQATVAQQVLGDSEPIHLIRATAYGLEGLLSKSAAEYRAALKFSPDDGSLHLALATTLYTERDFRGAVDEMLIAHKDSPNDDMVYAWLARTYAHLQDRDHTLEYVQLAEAHLPLAPTGPRLAPASERLLRGNEPGAEESQIFVFTGEALSLMGEQNAAMDRFRRALTTPGADRVSVRLAIAQLMAVEGHSDDARRQIALALMEAEGGETLPPTGAQYIQAADVFRQVHDYQLSQSYLRRAEAAGASDTTVRIGMANTYLAVGDTARAQAELSGINTGADSEPDYQYLLAEANVYRQEHESTQALTAFAQASNAAGDDQTAQQSLLEAGADEGLRVTPRLSMLSDFSVDPIFEDTTVYVLDSKLDATYPVPPTDTSLLPPPRSSIQTQWTGAYHLHWNYLPTASGFFQVRNARGLISVPATNSVVNRDTTDYTFNFGVNPTVHIGHNVLTFNNGIQATVRRDSESPVQLNQNLFREFTYMSTSAFFNAVSMDGYVIHETGPFTETNLHSRALSGAVDFRVGAPWGKTALVTGWGANDQQFNPEGIEDYYTSSYVGLDRRLSDKLDIRALAEDLRAWRIVSPRSGISQAFRPAGVVSYFPTHNWSIHASAAYSRTSGFHIYDDIQSGASVSYAVPVHRGFKDETGEVTLEYPIRFSAGFQEETFFNFSGAQNQQFRPYVSISLF